MGPEKHGRIQGLGFDTTPTNVWRSSSSRDRDVAHDAEVNVLKDEITNLKESNEQLKEVNKELKESNEEMKNTLAGLAEREATRDVEMVVRRQDNKVVEAVKKYFK